MTEHTRPDPDELLQRLKQQEALAARGRLKVLFGASAGVGKTFAMLSSAHAQKLQGVDVVIGVIETHGRAETEALVAGIERLPMKDVSYRDRTLKEFDLDAALERKPKLMLVDELAHSNVPGSRHPKRWQDVEELLDAGIDVWTTMNVQHLESLNDVVSGITGVRVWETVPDRVFDEADEVVIVDLPPDDLLQRLKEGKVYLPHQAERAVRNFFRKGNLIALRELALRRTADRVDDEMLQYRRTLSVAPVWQTREALLLCIGPDERSEKLVRAAARMAAQLDVPWRCVYVETPGLQRLPEARRQQILRVLKLAQDAGAVTATLTGNTLASTLVKYAHEHNLSRVVLGRDTGRWPRPWRLTLAEAVGALGQDLDVIQIALPPRERMQRLPAPGAAPSPSTGGAWRPYAMSAAVCGAVALLAAPLHSVFDLSNIVMVFLLAVVFVATRYGRGPAVLAAFLSVGAFDFLYVPPRFSFSVTDVQYLLTFGVMLVVALVIGQLTAGLKFQARVATMREERVSSLYEMSRDLSGALMAEQVAEIASRFLRSEFEARAALMIAGLDDKLQPPVAAQDLPKGVDQGVAQWAYDHSEAAGHGTNTLPASPMLYLPLKAPMRLRGVLAIDPANPLRLAGPEQRRLLDTCASLLALSLERIHYVDVAQSSTLQMESERLRNSLLAAISHDLRTPLSALVGMAESLPLTPQAQAGERATAIKEAALRMNSLVNNLLDMARLQAGPVQLNRQWLPLEELVGSALQAMAPSLDVSRVKVVLAADLPLVQVDAVLMERVFCNLLENAHKYTPPGSPIEISAVADSQQVRIMVDDRGPGLPRGREETIFEMFERGRKESSTAGVGLGLAICRAIVQAHGGRIRAENRANQGARFCIELPRGEPPAMPGAEEEGTA
ncbi:two-component system sensor histidine kinase KdpD [Piscinibacter terrae]|uniref:histidine kinase n=1 Tax=Piscinibacter terrae TaxID=2496871 RepID=A0A3N7HYD8_9BURK|nr:two-component system sensor histidine kinase KdpD [Albitalea terrae]RQP26111.1 two-component system sensor histidine kinase KdbD [Albitalea terrae]